MNQKQAKYADRQKKRKPEVHKQLVASGSVRQRIPANTRWLLRKSISEFNADAGKGYPPCPKSAFMCRMPEFSSEYFDDLPVYLRYRYDADGL